MSLLQFSVSAVTALATLSQATHVPQIDPSVDPTYTAYYKDEAADGYAPVYSSPAAFARYINSPNECFGDNLEVYEQLMSPEWQLCEVYDSDNEVSQLHMCSTESPSEILLRWMVNDVQEDSFQLELRRKTKWVNTNFFIDQEDTDYYNQWCPIDHNYAASFDQCSGSYRNGAFQYYPPFFRQGCQCQEVLDQMDLSAGFSPFVSYVTFEESAVSTENQASPCIFKLENETRKDTEKPNIWSQMNSIQIKVTVDQVPANGEVHLISSYSPAFWMNQPKTETHVITEAGTEKQFQSTHEVWIITRCVGGSCQGSTEAPYSVDEPGPTSFQIGYQKIEIPKEEQDFPDWSMVITICIGFSLMFIAFLYFEWRCVLQGLKRCQERSCGSSGQRQIGLIEENDGISGYKNSHESYNESGDENIEQQINHNLDRLVQKQNKKDTSYGEPQVGFDEYASNRQD